MKRSRPHISGDCAKCGTWRRSLHRDHILARCRGGADTPENIQLLCANCHEDKTRLDLMGRKCPKSPETRAKISAALKGRTISEAHRERLRIINSGRVGHRLSHETRAKIAARALGRTGRVATAETRAKMSRAQTEWWANATPEMRAKITAKLTGRIRGPHTPEAKAKMSEARRAAWRRQKDGVATVTGL